MKGLAVVAFAVAGALVAGAAPAHAAVPRASQDTWEVVALYSKPAWKTSRPRQAILQGCRTGRGAPFALGTTVVVRDKDENVLGEAAVTRVRVAKASGHYICRFSADVPVAPSATSLILVEVGTAAPLLTSVDDVSDDEWEVAFWPT